MPGISDYFSALHAPDDIIEVRAIWSDRAAGKSPQSAWLTAAEWGAPANIARLGALNSEGWNIYAGVLPRTRMGARGNAETLPAAILWADIDHVTPEEADARLGASGLPPPSVKINTGHGVQCYWLLTGKRPPSELRPLVRDIALWLESDTSVQNEERVLRLPGFTNHKPPIADATLLDCRPDIRYDFDAIREMVPGNPVVSAPVPAIPGNASGADETVERARRYLATIPGAGQGGRTNTAYRVAAVLVKDYALDASTAVDLLTRWDAAANNPPIQDDPQYGPKEIANIVTNAGRYGKHARGNFLEPARHDGFDVARFIRNSTPAEAQHFAPVRIANPGALPEYFLEVPGFVGEVIECANRRAVKRQPNLALAAGIATLGTLAGRKVEGATGLRTNFYCLGVADSGDGKDKPREIIRQILYESGNGDLYSSDRLKSDAGIRSALEVNPCTLFLLDEMGEMLETIKGARHSPWLRNIIPELLTLYSSAQSSGVKLGGYSDAKRTITVDCPHVCVFGTSVPESVFHSMTVDSITGGFLGRLLIFESNEKNPRKQRPSREGIPASIIETAKWWREFKPNGELTGNFAGSTSAPQLVDESPEAEQIFDSCEEAVRAEIEHLPPHLASLFKRCEENGRKLAIIYACSECKERPFIGANAARWGVELALYLARRLAFLADANIADNDTHEKRNKVLNIIRDSGRMGLSKSELLRKCRYLKTRELGEILDALSGSEEIAIEETQSAGNNKPMFRIVAAELPPIPP